MERTTEAVSSTPRTFLISLIWNPSRSNVPNTRSPDRVHAGSNAGVVNRVRRVIERSAPGRLFARSITQMFFTPPSSEVNASFVLSFDQAGDPAEALSYVR